MTDSYEEDILGAFISCKFSATGTFRISANCVWCYAETTSEASVLCVDQEILGWSSTLHSTLHIA
jgi:hypothetical protein